MKKIPCILFFALALASCNNEKKSETTPETEVATTNEEVKYATFGDSISADGYISMTEMKEKYDNLTLGDTIHVKFKSKTKKVCQKKGCWMTVDLGEEKESFVRFKDYLFTIPRNAEDRDVITEGKAYLEEIPVDELKHYAKDAGKSQEEIDQITEPKRTLRFEATGVLIAEQ
ncbi:DUF4920 domain-containing protein [Avrilella dinanensis]|uniref:DUF4920 domain-containing protein n=1 Tax=Avrilella dinanensis TaxID=2008672 RepID=UPI002409189E|nr:DUF4920 domain-containing protein [Avrilella dinanensis]